jgi:HPt (histidine-containing phosphotransfer) domain-containing protein
MTWSKDFVLIDDDPVFCHAMVAAARAQGYNMDYFCNLMEITHRSDFNEYKVAIIDFQLEQMNGLEAAEYLPMFFHDMPVLLVSAKDRIDGNGSDRFWPKSICRFENKNSGLDQILDAAISLLQKANGSAAAQNQKNSRKVNEKHFKLPQIEDQDFVTKLCGIFSSTSAEVILNIRNAIHSSDFKIVAIGAHKLKGSAYTIGAKRLAEFCHTLEHFHMESDVDKMKSLVNEIDKERKRVSDTCKDLTCLTTKENRGDAKRP